MPKAVNLKTLSQYNKLHTRIVKCYSGVTMIALYLIKETSHFFMGIEVWAGCRKFKQKKPFNLSVDIPIITNKEAVDFLNKNCWDNWVEKEKENVEMIEALKYLKMVFPNHVPIFFYEFYHLFTAYSHGTFIKYDDNGLIEPPSSHDIKNQKYYTNKYNRHLKAPEVVAAKLKWTSEKDAKLSEKYLDEYCEIEREYAFKHHNLNDVFIEIGKHAVCFPVGFTKGTADWHMKEYGKVCSYAHAGEIYFVVTDKNIYFDVSRHF